VALAVRAAGASCVATESCCSAFNFVLVLNREPGACPSGVRWLSVLNAVTPWFTPGWFKLPPRSLHLTTSKF